MKNGPLNKISHLILCFKKSCYSHVISLLFLFTILAFVPTSQGYAKSLYEGYDSDLAVDYSQAPVLFFKNQDLNDHPFTLEQRAVIKRINLKMREYLLTKNALLVENARFLSCLKDQNAKYSRAKASTLLFEKQLALKEIEEDLILLKNAHPFLNHKVVKAHLKEDRDHLALLLFIKNAAIEPFYKNTCAQLEVKDASAQAAKHIKAKRNIIKAMPENVFTTCEADWNTRAGTRTVNTLLRYEKQNVQKKPYKLKISLKNKKQHLLDFEKGVLTLGPLDLTRNAQLTDKHFTVALSHSEFKDFLSLAPHYELTFLAQNTGSKNNGAAQIDLSNELQSDAFPACVKLITNNKSEAAKLPKGYQIIEQTPLTAIKASWDEQDYQDPNQVYSFKLPKAWGVDYNSDINTVFFGPINSSKGILCTSKQKSNPAVLGKNTTQLIKQLIHSGVTLKAIENANPDAFNIDILEFKAMNSYAQQALYEYTAVIDKNEMLIKSSHVLTYNPLSGHTVDILCSAPEKEWTKYDETFKRIQTSLTLLSPVNAVDELSLDIIGDNEELVENYVSALDIAGVSLPSAEQSTEPALKFKDKKRVINRGYLSAAAQHCDLDWKQKSFTPFLLETNFYPEPIRPYIVKLHGFSQGIFLKALKGQGQCDQTMKELTSKRLEKLKDTSRLK